MGCRAPFAAIRERDARTRAVATRTPGGDAMTTEQSSRDHLKTIWKRAYKAETTDDLRRLYADWAKTYDDDHDAVGFFGHKRAAEMLARYVTHPEVSPVLDAGAGTGAAGVELAQRGFKLITAVDLSAEMLDQARQKGIYQHVMQADLGLPMDKMPSDNFQAAILVGVFSYGQAPACTLEEIVRVVRPGGVVVLTMRTDFYESDAMGIRSKIGQLVRTDAWQLVEVTPPEQYLPKKDPDAKFRVWCYRVLETKKRPVPETFADDVRAAFESPDRIKRLDHCHIWNAVGSRLYDRYIECPDYYLSDCEMEILQKNAPEIAGNSRRMIELGCGSATKIRFVLDAALAKNPGSKIAYTPIDLSSGALASTREEIEEAYGDRVSVDIHQGHFNDILPTIPDDLEKALFFFGGSIGNIETLEDTVHFLAGIRERMTPRDRFFVGIDLDKDKAILRRAYEAGPKNLSFFLNMVRRINDELGANFDLTAFKQRSTYDKGESYQGIEDHCVHFKLVSEAPQKAHITKLGMEVELAEGDAIQVGISRKYRLQDIPRLLELAGLRLERQWLDAREFVSLNECRVA